MQIKEYRKKAGKTIQDIVEETNLPKAYLSALDEGRRKLLEPEAILLSPIYKKTVEELMQCSNNNNMIEAIKNYGCFNHIEEYNDDEELKHFIYIMNDIWHLFINSCNLDFINEHDLKITLLKNLIHDYNETESYNKKFPFTTYHNGLCICWVELYSANEVLENINTVVLEDVTGISIHNNPEIYVNSLLKQLLLKKGWSVERGIRFVYRYYCQGVKYSEMLLQPSENEKDNGKRGDIYRKLSVIFKALTKEEDTSFEIKCYSSDNLNLVNKPKQRTYRRYVKAIELPKPFHDNETICRSDEKNLYCPVRNNRLPTEKESCSYCKGLVNSWKAFVWLVEHLSDDEFRSTPKINNLKEKYPLIFQEFVNKYGNFDEAAKMYSFAYDFGSYSFRNSVHISQGEYINGRHRTKIAQLLDIAIPVNWSTYEKINNCEIVE